MRKPPKSSVLIALTIVGSALFLASQSLQGYGADVLIALVAAAGLMAWWNTVAAHDKAGAARSPGRDAGGAAPSGPPGAGQGKTAPNDDLWVVLQINVPPPEVFQHRLSQVEKHLSQAQRMQAAGAPVEPLVLALLHEEIRYLRVMVSLANDVARRQTRP